MSDLVQIQNPKTKRWCIIDRDEGEVVNSAEMARSPYSGIPIVSVHCGRKTKKARGVATKA